MCHTPGASEQGAKEDAEPVAGRQPDQAGLQARWVAQWRQALSVAQRNRYFKSSEVASRVESVV